MQTNHSSNKKLQRVSWKNGFFKYFFNKEPYPKCSWKRRRTKFKTTVTLTSANFGSNTHLPVFLHSSLPNIVFPFLTTLFSLFCFSFPSPLGCLCITFSTSTLFCYLLYVPYLSLSTWKSQVITCEQDNLMGSLWVVTSLASSPTSCQKSTLYAFLINPCSEFCWRTPSFQTTS